MTWNATVKRYTIWVSNGLGIILELRDTELEREFQHLGLQSDTFWLHVHTLGYRETIYFNLVLGGLSIRDPQGTS